MYAALPLRLHGKLHTRVTSRIGTVRLTLIDVWVWLVINILS